MVTVIAKVGWSRWVVGWAQEVERQREAGRDVSRGYACMHACMHADVCVFACT
jgi:hypothetical protein